MCLLVLNLLAKLCTIRRILSLFTSIRNCNLVLEETKAKVENHQEKLPERDSTSKKRLIMKTITLSLVQHEINIPSKKFSTLDKLTHVDFFIRNQSRSSMMGMDLLVISTTPPLARTPSMTMMTKK